MASAADFFNELKGSNQRLDGVNLRLDEVKSRLDAIKASADSVRQSVDQMNQVLQAGINQLVILGTYTNEALFHNAQQNDTMICLLEQISNNTCGLLNESVVQTRLQTAMKANTQLLADLYAATHAEAALERQRLEQLQSQIEQCCPPTPLPPACTDKPCPKPNRLGKPPKLPRKDPGPIL